MDALDLVVPRQHTSPEIDFPSAEPCERLGPTQLSLSLQERVLGRDACRHIRKRGHQPDRRPHVTKNQIGGEFDLEGRAIAPQRDQHTGHIARAADEPRDELVRQCGITPELSDVPSLALIGALVTPQAHKGRIHIGQLPLRTRERHPVLGTRDRLREHAPRLLPASALRDVTHQSEDAAHPGVVGHHAGTRLNPARTPVRMMNRQRGRGDLFPQHRAPKGLVHALALTRREETDFSQAFALEAGGGETKNPFDRRVRSNNPAIKFQDEHGVR